MMSGGPGRSTYSFRSPAPCWVRSFLERAGAALARAPLDHGLLIELRPGERFPRLTSARPEFETTLGAIAASLPGLYALVPAGPIPPGPVARDRMIGFLVARGRPAEDGAPRDPRGGGPLPLELPRARPLGLDVQAHWFPDPSGRLRVRIRYRSPGPSADEATLLAGGTELARRIEAAGADPLEIRLVHPRWGSEREWADGRLDRLQYGPPLLLAPSAAAAGAPLDGPAREAVPDLVRHTVVLGSTGSGKTSWVASLAADRIAHGTPVLLFDVHGDLAPRVVARLGPRDRERVLAIDATGGPEGIPGLSILEGGGDGADDAAAADVVAALKRLSSEGGETYWGFRLERIFDTFVRLVQDEGGTLLDLVALLTEERRRESARLTTRRPEAIRFLEELPAILRRSPEFLWPAASRLSKIALVPSLGALLAPTDGGLPLEAWVGQGGSIAWRLPFASLGPEGASLAGTLLATRAYLALARSPVRRGKRLRALFVLDEAHAFSARLLAEMLAEGRKFGLGVVVATQYPERLDPALRAAAAGAVGHHVVFRVPPASAREVGRWLGLPADEAERLLPTLPVGSALSAGSDGPAQAISGTERAVDATVAWDGRVRATRREFVSPETLEGSVGAPALGDVLLLELVGRERFDGDADGKELLEALAGRALDPIDPEAAGRELDRLVDRGWVARSGDRLRATPAGARQLGIGAPTGAISESAEHRGLLVEALRIFAGHGLRLEILRQGRFDTRLPDAVVPIAPPAAPGASPEEIFRALAARRATWAWRFFGGRNVHVEAEVSGADRRERIRRGLGKAERRGAYALFLVADGRRARRVRSVLVDAGAYPLRAQVWTLPRARPRTAAPQPLRS